MADERPTLHIDTDWKKQAQEEKKRLVEQAQKEPPKPATAAPSALSGRPGAAVASATASGRPGTGRGQREIPQASFATLVQSLMSQALYYLGDLAVAGQQSVNLDMAKHQLDALGVLEVKVKNNLDADEQKLLDTALYEVRMRYVSVASQYL